MRRTIGLVFIISFTCVAHMSAWGDRGHQIVARIAARSLTATARRHIVALIRQAPDDDIGLKQIVGLTGTPPTNKVETALTRMATWPDCMGRDAQNQCNPKGASDPWHYIDVGLFENPAGPGVLDARCPATNACVTKKIVELEENLQHGTSLSVVDGTITRVFPPDRELRFLVHFVGDIHQPLHVVTNADAGGNCLALTGFDGIKPELHAAWDVALVDRAMAGRSASSIITEFRAEQASVAAVTHPSLIAVESFRRAKIDVYGKARPAVPIIDHFVRVSPSSCSQDAPPEILAITVDGRASFDNAATKRLVREQLFKAGTRLAAILNTVFH